MSRSSDGLKENENQQRKAGRKSGSVRGRRTEIRRFFVKAAFKRLPRAFQGHPFSDSTIDALQEECLKTPSAVNEDFDKYIDILLAGEHLTKPVPRDTLIKDLKALGIRSKRRVTRSG
jgi:hypothetical protein